MPLNAMKGLGTAILTTILSGLSLTIYNIFTEKIPTLETKVEILENKTNNQKEYLHRIDNRTEKIYEILLENKE